MLRLRDKAVDLDRGLVVGPDGTLRLTTTEVRLLRYLAERLGQDVSREELHREVWGHGPRVLSRALDTTVRRLRRKLGDDPRLPAALLTVHGVGYRLLGEDATAEPGAAERAATLVGPIRAGGSRSVPPAWIEGAALLREGLEASMAFGRADEAAAIAVAWLRVIRRIGPYADGPPVADRVLALRPSDALAVLVDLAAAPLDAGAAGAERVRRARSRAPDPATRCVALLARLPGDESEPDAREAVAIARGLGDPALMAQALGELATRLHLRAPDESQRLFLEALEHAQASGDRWEEAVVGGNFAGLLRTLGDLDGAAARYRTTLDPLDRLGDVWSCQVVWMSLGTLHAQRLHLEESQACLQRALDLAERLGNVGAAARARVNLCGLALDRGLPVDPLGIDAMLGVLRRVRDREYEAVALLNQGVAWRVRGQPGLARTALERALALAEELALLNHVPECLGELALLDAETGAPESAWDRMGAALDGLRGRASRDPLRARYLLARAAWAQALGRPLPEAAELRALAARLPAVEGTAWAGLAAWRDQGAQSVP